MSSWPRQHSTATWHPSAHRDIVHKAVYLDVRPDERALLQLHEILAHALLQPLCACAHDSCDGQWNMRWTSIVLEGSTMTPTWCGGDAQCVVVGQVHTLQLQEAQRLSYCCVFHYCSAAMPPVTTGPCFRSLCW